MVQKTWIKIRELRSIKKHLGTALATMIFKGVLILEGLLN